MKNKDNQASPRALEVKNLTKHYGKKKVLNGLSMNVPACSVYGFLGINGAGKTTTFGLLSGFLPMEEGIVKASGKISVLPQDAAFYSGRGVFDQMKFFAALSGIPGRNIKEEVERVLELVGLEDQWKSAADKLSHGMKKKLAIAQAFLGNPEIILLDEPTAGLDPKNIIEIRQLIIEMGKEKTMVISSHILSEIAEMCDTLGILHQGQMKFEGPMEEITGLTSRVKYRITGIPPEDLYSSLEGVTGFDITGTELIITYDSSLISIEEINKKVIQILYRHDCGLTEIHRGHSLEEGFLNLLK